MKFLKELFGGGNSKNTRDEKSVQKEINSRLKKSGGQFTREINDLVAKRTLIRSGDTGGSALSQGLGSFGRAVRSIPGNIARDVKMGTSAGLFSGRDKQAETLKSKGFSQADIKDYFARTDATKARNNAQQGSRRNERSNDAPVRAPIDAPVDKQGPVYRNPFGSLNQLTFLPSGPASGAPAEITPAMRNEALRIFESQRGAGQVPYQMQAYQQGLGSMPRPRFMPQQGMQQQQMNERMRQQQMMRQPMSRAPDPFDGMRSIGFGNQMVRQPGTFPMPQPGTPQPRGPMPQPPMQQPQMPRFQPMPQPRMPMPQPPMQQNPNVSPAFQRAAQNYQRLGGSQRTMDRPMEMMSVAERQRINTMAQGMADRQRPTSFPGKGGQRPTSFPGKGNVRFEPQPFSPDGMRQSDTLGRLLPLLGQMGLGGFRGSGMPPR